MFSLGANMNDRISDWN